MRRAQSLRHNARNSFSGNQTFSGMGGLTELGTLTEESPEDLLRKQVRELERENDKLKSQLLIVQDQLRQRPPIDRIQELEREYNNLELILQGTQRENERCMAELERGKAREKILERELCKLAGDNWQTVLGVPGSTVGLTSRAAAFASPRTSLEFTDRPHTPASPSTFGHTSRPRISTSTEPSTASTAPTSPSESKPPVVNNEAVLAHIEQVRLLILGMDQQLQAREEKLTKAVGRAEEEGRRLESLRAEQVKQISVVAMK